MEEERLMCNAEYVSTIIIAVLCILILIGVRKCFRKAKEMLPPMNVFIPQQKTAVVNLHREVAELRRNTQKISKDWEGISILFQSLRDQESNFKEHFNSEMRNTNKALQDGMRKTSEEFSNNNQKLEEIIHFFRNELNSLKEMIVSHGEILLKNLEQCGPLKGNCTHMWTQTEREIIVKRKSRDSKEGKSGENDNTKITATGIQKILLEFQKEARKNSLREGEAVISHIEAILNQMSQDQEVIKNIIHQAFETSTYQSQKSFEQLGAVGQQALECVVEKTEKSNVLMKDKFQEFDKKLNMIFDGMHNTSFDVSSIKTTLDNLDSQLDDIFQRMEIGCQKNVEHCEEVLGGLENATEVWKESSTRLTEMARLLGSITSGVENLMKELNMKTEESKKVLTELSKDKQMLQTITSPKKGAEQNKERQIQFQPFVRLQAAVHICTGKVSTLNDRLDNGMSEIKLTIENLLRQIRFMCDLVDSLGERFKFREIESVKKKLQTSKDQEKELLGDTCRSVGKEKDNPKPMAGEVSIVSDCKTTGDSNLKTDTNVRTPKRPKLVSKIKPPASPIKKGKTIYSNISSSNAYNKHVERNQGSVRK